MASLADDLLAVLNDPTYMWSHALKESSRDSQRLFLMLSLLPQPMTVNDLQVAHSRQAITPGESFLDSLRALDDSFVTVGLGFQGIRWIDFRNPSLQDFANQHLNEYFDWLDTLLSSPAFYQQILGAYKLGMAREPGRTILSREPDGTPKRSYREGKRKFEAINNWIERRHASLMEHALDLIASGDKFQLHYRYEIQDSCRNIQELLQIAEAYGMPPSDKVRQTMSSLVQQALEPATKTSASIMLDLIQEPKTAAMINEFTAGDAAQILRDNLLDKDNWKFDILSQLDQTLEIGTAESMAAWGTDYVDYAEGIVNNPVPSGNPDDLEEVIRELESMSIFLDLDFYDEIERLEVMRDSLRRKIEETDYEGYAGASPKGGNSNPMRELDRIFSIFLD